MLVSEGLKRLEMGFSECSDRCGHISLLLCASLLILYLTEGNGDSHYSLLASFSTSSARIPVLHLEVKSHLLTVCESSIAAAYAPRSLPSLAG